MNSYTEFLESKRLLPSATGIEPQEPHAILFDFQRAIVKWALRRGRACILADCGLGKTLMQLEWARQIPGEVLIVAPLAVAQQTVEEAEKIGLIISFHRSGSEIHNQITVCNYEMLEHFDLDRFAGIVLDESSILKQFDGKTRQQVVQGSRNIPYRLACTATPAPNDFMELGNHAEFVGAMTMAEMLSMFFIHDGGETSKWRLKGHAESEFWKWVCSWAVMLRKPSDLGFVDNGFILPPCQIHSLAVDGAPSKEHLFPMEALTLSERIGARRDSVSARVGACAQLVNKSGAPWVIWCNLNAEADALAKAIPGAVEIRGDHSVDFKRQSMVAFVAGKIRVLVTKPSISGHGMNWQHCWNMAFVGLSDSWEDYYQAVRRCWRFGQKRMVNVHIIMATTEGQVLVNIRRKEAQAAKMMDELITNMHSISEENLRGVQKEETNYRVDDERGDGWRMILGDCVEECLRLKTDSIDYSIFSPPFASLYTYSASERDMGNTKDQDSFALHFGFLVPELFRVLKPGRLLSFHCMNLPASKTRDGYIGLKDFRGVLIAGFVEAGFIFHSEVCIWKDPVVAMQRTKALGLLHKQMVKDSCMSRQGVPDYLVTMRKPGLNANPVAGELEHWIGDNSFKSNGRLSIDLWQRYASPVWMDINPSRTLQKDSAREEKDERHICPLQLDVIERCLMLWSNEGDVVLSPFAGIGSEGWCAIKEGRKFIGIELKESYWKQAVANLQNAQGTKAMDLFQPENT